MLRRKTTKNTTKKRRIPKPRKNSRFLEMAIVVIFALVLIYGASFAIRITHGLSRTVDGPEYIIRLQILNGCGIHNAAGRMAKAFPELVRLPLEVDVVEVDNFKSYHVRGSFLISRNKDLKPVRILAEQLGLDADSIIYEPIENNYRSISATLILGEDFETIIIKP